MPFVKKHPGLNVPSEVTLLTYTGLWHAQRPHCAKSRRCEGGFMPITGVQNSAGS